MGKLHFPQVVKAFWAKRYVPTCSSQSNILIQLKSVGGLPWRSLQIRLGVLIIEEELESCCPHADFLSSLLWKNPLITDDLPSL